MKWLIVNADDFGRTHNNNIGVTRTFEHGMVTATSLVAGGAAFDDAAAYARRHPELDLGVHLALDEVRPMLPRQAIPDLTDEKGAFLPRARILLKLLTAPAGVPEQVRAEWQAQVARIVDAGLRPSHLDGHGHVHVHPRLQGVVKWLQERFDIRACRCPTGSLLHSGRPRRYVEKLLVHGCAGYARLRGHPGVFSPDHFHGFMEGGQLTVRRIERIFRHLGEGVNELMAHPGGDNRDEPFGVPYDWEGDMNALLAVDPLEAQRRYGFGLISYRDAARMAR